MHRLSFDQLTYFGHAPASWYLAEAIIFSTAWCLAMSLASVNKEGD